MNMGIPGLAGVVLTLAGLTGVGYSIRKLFVIRRSGMTDSEARESMLRLLPVNLAALLVAVFGLMLIIVELVL
ncbi:MAG: hypothetical protein OXC91_11690 [Rhodobacteraceae bacterium]|nr:hypothetical protein [Paracoccaceae bacterium]